MDAPAFVAVGRVIKTHGLNGEVSVAPVAGTSLDALVGVEVWFAPPPPSVRSAQLIAVRRGPKGPLVSFEGVRDATSARALCGSNLLVNVHHVPSGAMVEAPDEPDLIGYGVEDTTRGTIGRITETIVTGANDVWVVEGPFGEVLVPVIDDVVLSVDDTARMVSVKLLDGLLPGEGTDA